MYELKKETVEVTLTAPSLHTEDSCSAVVYGEARVCREFFNNAVVGIFQSTPDGHYLNVNPALARMYGYESPDHLMRSVADIGNDIYVDPANRAEFKKRVQSEGRVEALEYQVRRKDGKAIWICEHAWAVHNFHGKLLYYEGTIQDITRRKIAEMEKAELEIKLRHAQKIQAIGTLAGGIAHDFNNILSAIIGFTEITLDELPPGGESRENLQEVLAAGHRARDLVKQILSFSRPSTSDRQPVRLEYVIREVIKMMNASLPANIRCCKSISTSQDWVLADPTQLHQVLMNIATNAGYAMRGKGGTLAIKLDAVQQEQPLCTAISELPAGSYLRLSISDTGCGMTQEVIDRVFDPFFTTKQVGEGTGLGLSVVQGIVLSYGGGISVQSQPGMGTVFQVFLPQLSRSVETTPGAVSEPIRGQGRILVVDDEEMLVRIAQKKLRALGYSVISRMDSAEALRSFKADPDKFDLVITDQDMPWISGTELCVAIRKIRPDVPMVICSGLPHPWESMGTLDAVFTMLKPLDYTALSQLLHKVLAKSRTGKTARRGAQTSSAE